MNKTCQLCNENKELRDSHLVPKFVFNWMKKTGSSYFRNVTTPNKREQDGVKRKLLCTDCEGNFSKHETWYSRYLFHPILDDMVANGGKHTITSFKYDENLYCFCLSFLWRALKVNLIDKDFSEEHIDILKKVEEEWRNFLNKKIYPQNWNNVHMWVLDKCGDFEGKPPKFDFYIMRVPDGTIAFGEGQLFIFAKAARFMFFAPLIGFEDESLFVNTKINPVGGEYVIPQEILDTRISGFLVNRVKQIFENASSLTTTQMELISEQVEKEREKLWGSDLHRSLSNDLD